MVGRDSLSDLDPASMTHSLRRLQGRFSPGAKVYLHGCTLGRANELLMAVSAALGGVAVLAGTNVQNPFPGLEGGVVQCVQLPGQAGSCTTVRNIAALGKLDAAARDRVDYVAQHTQEIKAAFWMAARRMAGV